MTAPEPGEPSDVEIDALVRDALGEIDEQRFITLVARAVQPVDTSARPAASPGAARIRRWTGSGTIGGQLLAAAAVIVVVAVGFGALTSRNNNDGNATETAGQASTTTTATGPEAPAATVPGPTAAEREEQLRAGIADCDRRIAKYHQLLDHDVDPALAAAWITEAQQERQGLETQLGHQIPGEQLSSSQVKALVDALRDIVGTLAAANPTAKADLYRELGVELRYDPNGTVTVRAQPRGVKVRVGGASPTPSTCDPWHGWLECA